MCWQLAVNSEWSVLGCLDGAVMAAMENLWDLCDLCDILLLETNYEKLGGIMKGIQISRISQMISAVMAAKDNLWDL
jgi:hypothetical protein